MKVLVKMILGLMTTLSLANCKVSADGKTFDLVEQPVPCNASVGDICELSEGPLSESMTYFEGGGYPAPNRANWSMDLTFTVISKTNVKLSAKTPICSNGAYISVADYIELETVLLNARTTLGLHQMIDRGNEYMNVNIGSSKRAIYLSEGDSTYKKQVVIAEDNNKIHKTLDRILSKTFSGGICPRLNISPNLEI